MKSIKQFFTGSISHGYFFYHFLYFVTNNLGYYYIDDKISSPFKAKCVEKRLISPLEVGETFEVLGMAPESECEHEMFVMVQWQGRKLGVPLAQVAVVEGDEATREAVEDWQYWTNRGYEF